MPMRLTPAVKALLISCVAMFVIQQGLDRWAGTDLLSWLSLVPSQFATNFRFWQIVTYSFLHGDVFHLFFNMLMLAFIGGEIEASWGTKRFLRYYFFCVVAAGALYLALQFLVWGGLNAPMVGASGGIYGLLMAYGLIFGERVLLFMMLFPMKAKHFVWILMGLEFLTSVFSGRGGLASAAHLGGMIAGFGYLYGAAYLKVARNRSRKGLDPWTGRQKPRKKAKHLKLVINKPKGPADDDVDEGGPRTWH